MTGYSRCHLTNAALIRELAIHLTQERSTTVALLADLAEVDARKLYVTAGYASMYLYCVQELHMSEDVAYKRICIARTARRFPAAFPMLADGRLNQTAVLLLAPHLAPDNADDLLAAATHKTKPEMESLLAQRFPQPDLPTLLQAVPTTGATPKLDQPAVAAPAVQLAPERAVASVQVSSPSPVEPLSPRARIAPLSPERFALQVTITGTAHDLLRQAQALLGHTVPSGDVAQVIERALEALVQKLEKQKFAKCARSGPRRGTASARHVPAAVKREVFERDRGQCTFLGENGKRCEARTRLEFDHVHPVARGGQATVSGIRLLCRAHNQHAADCTFGAGFMHGKREQARDRAAQANLHTQAGVMQTPRAANIASLVTSPSPPHPAAAPRPGERPRT
jgi:5-methylcytosine-specific restriction endonuclease McrA